ncbi:MAG: hypothetical protein AAB451_00805 [Patescibacteria group bacterium]
MKTQMINNRVEEIKTFAGKVGEEVAAVVAGMEEVDRVELRRLRVLPTHNDDHGLFVAAKIALEGKLLWGYLDFYRPGELVNGPGRDGKVEIVIKSPSWASGTSPHGDVLDDVEGFLTSFGGGWGKASEKVEVIVAQAAEFFRRGFTEVTGKSFDYSREITTKIERSMEREEINRLHYDLETEKKTVSGLRAEISQLQVQISSKSAELAEVRREQQTKEEIARAMAETIVVQSKLDLAILKLAVQKAVADLAATKGISKSRRFAQIRQSLEAAICPVRTSDDDFADGSDDQF